VIESQGVVSAGRTQDVIESFTQQGSTSECITRSDKKASDREDRTGKHHTEKTVKDLISGDGPCSTEGHHHRGHEPGQLADGGRLTGTTDKRWDESCGQSQTAFGNSAVDTVNGTKQITRQLVDIRQ
jgi:hypothetical protein